MQHPVTILLAESACDGVSLFFEHIINFHFFLGIRVDKEVAREEKKIKLHQINTEVKQFNSPTSDLSHGVTFVLSWGHTRQQIKVI